MVERTFRATEFRTEGRRLSGQIIAYADTSPSHRERFLPGAFTFDAVPLNYRHNQLCAIGWHPDGGVEIRDTEAALTMAADLPPLPAADRALKEVRAGSLSGLSVEFVCEKDRREAGIRIIERARLVGVGLVDAPSYPGSVVEARRREMRGPEPDDERQYWSNRRRAVSGKMPLGSIAGCRCQGKDCNQVKFLPGAWEKAIADAASGELDISATTGSNNVENILGSTKKGTLQLIATEDGGVGFSIAQTRVPALLALLAASETAAPIARPIIDNELSVFEDEIIDGELVRVYSEIALKSILVKWAESKGWPELVIDEFVDAGLDEFDEFLDAGGDELLANRSKRGRASWWL